MLKYALYDGMCIMVNINMHKICKLEKMQKCEVTPYVFLLCIYIHLNAQKICAYRCT